MRPRSSSTALPRGLLAWREYEVKLESGEQIVLAFSLAGSGHKSLAKMMHAYDARHVGMLVVLGDPDSQEEAVVWLQQDSSLSLVSRSGDAVISHEVKDILPRYFAAFFDEIKDVAPALAEVKLVAAKTGDRKLH